MFNFEDLKYLFKNEVVNSKEIYKQDLQRNNKTIGEIRKFNKDFSQSLFASWVSNIFLRYILFCSNKAESYKLISFEKIHLSNGAKPNWYDVLDIYSKYKDINVKFVDYIDYTHTEAEDFLLLKICLLCDLKNELEVTESQTIYYDIKLKKENVAKTESGKDNYTSNCPNCGAPTSISTFGICSHCQELVSIYDNVWKIINIRIDE